MPPGGFKYLEPTTKRWIPKDGYDTNVDATISKVQAFLKSNSLPVPPNLRALIEDQICERLSGNLSWCNNGNIASTEEINASRRGWAFSFEHVKTFTATMIDWWVNGGERVSDEIISERAKVCSGCPNNTHPPGCTSCSSGVIRGIVARIVGGHSHPMDVNLRACAICGCDLRAKVRIPQDTLTRNMPKEKLAVLPPFCWLKPK
jgi:hypothetical protein